jgi:activating signal cointegrator complex subunit 3
LYDCLQYLGNDEKTSDEIFDNVLNLLNGDFDATSFLLENRDAIVREWKDQRTQVETKMASHKSKTSKKNYANVSATMTMSRARDKELEAKFGVATDENMPITNHEILAMLGLDEAELKIEAKLGLKSKNIGQKVNLGPDEEFEKEDEVFDFVNLMSTKVMEQLGPRFTKVDREDYLTYSCLPLPQLQSVPDDKLVQISDFPEYLREVFTGIARLNPLQSKVKDMAFDSDENLLVCAPTGAGKTNVALMTVLHEVNRAWDPLREEVGEFKVVYISPLKALAAEITDKFAAR